MILFIFCSVDLLCSAVGWSVVCYCVFLCSVDLLCSAVGWSFCGVFLCISLFCGSPL